MQDIIINNEKISIEYDEINEDEEKGTTDFIVYMDAKIDEKEAIKEINMLIANNINPYDYIEKNCIEKIIYETKKTKNGYILINKWIYPYGNYYSIPFSKKCLEWRDPIYDIEDIIIYNNNKYKIVDLPSNIKECNNPLEYEYSYGVVLVDENFNEYDRNIFYDRIYLDENNSKKY